MILLHRTITNIMSIFLHWLSKPFRVNSIVDDYAKDGGPGVI